jgi:hypothetical protein
MTVDLFETPARRGWPPHNRPRRLVTLSRVPDVLLSLLLTWLFPR